MSIVKKRIGNNIYEYDVIYNPKTKKQIWKYLGKKSSDIEIEINETFTKTEISEIKNAYKLSVKHRAGKVRDSLKLICDKLNIKFSKKELKELEDIYKKALKRSHKNQESK